MVEDLLAEDERAGSFLQHPPFESFDKSTENISYDAEETKPIVGDGTSSTTAAIGRLKLGEILMGRFRVVRFIAKGGMGEVYEAEDSFLQDVHVALKTILPHIAGDPSSTQRFEREVLLARGSYPSQSLSDP